MQSRAYSELSFQINIRSRPFKAVMDAMSKDTLHTWFPACSSKFVEQLLDDSDKSNPLYRNIPFKALAISHGTLLRHRIVEHVSGSGKRINDPARLIQAFVHWLPPNPGPNRAVSASMAYGMHLLQIRLQHIDKENCWPSTVPEAGIVISILRRAIRKKMSHVGLHDTFKLALKFLNVKPELQRTFQSADFWPKLIVHWKRAPDVYSDLVVEALRLGLGGSADTIGRDFLNTLHTLNKTRELRPELKWPLLRLFCLHVPERGLDLDTASDFTPLRKKKWPIELFRKLDREHAIRLLQGLHDANVEYGFLEGSYKPSILACQEITSQRNFNATLLLLQLRGESAESQPAAEAALDQLRKQAATSREQQDRAQFAEAASFYAIATGSLDFYGETVIWQKRFVRDPLTVKKIFAANSVATAEGIELLSGIPLPLPTNSTLAQVAVRVEKANKILLTFHELQRDAKREPSFSEQDWYGVASLFGSVVSKRVSRARELQKSLRSSDFDIYASIWEGTLAMLHKVNARFLTESYRSVIGLLSALPPTALASATRNMLDAGTKRRAMKDREPGDDTLEKLSYQALLMLAKGDKPELAQDLVLQTILDRPDASSWHRQLLSARFLNRLSAKASHDLLLSFAAAIGERLSEQSYVKVGEAQPSKPAPPESLVKVTTVKYLANLLQNVTYISAEASLDILVELFEAGTHIDIRLATLDSLLGLLNYLCSVADSIWKSNPLVEKIISALKTVIPVAGSINERRPPTAADWKEAVEKKSPPDVSDITDSLPPLMSAIMRAPNAGQYPGLKNVQSELVKALVLPLLEHSQAEHRRWIAVFLSKHKMDNMIDHLPPTPISPRLWNFLIENYLEFIPQTLLDDFNQYTIMMITPPARLRRFNSFLKKDVQLRNSSETRHWISVFDQRMTPYHSSNTQVLVRMVRYKTMHPSSKNAISSQKISKMIVGQASLYLEDYENYQDFWNELIWDLRHPSTTTHPGSTTDDVYLHFEEWQQSGKIILQEIVKLILDKRREQAKLQKLSVLPSATKPQILLLRYPWCPSEAEIDPECEKFANELAKMLANLLSGEPGVLHWHKLSEESFTVSKLLDTDIERLAVAFYIGKITPTSSGPAMQRSQALNFIRVVLAMKLIEDGRNALRSTEKDGKTRKHQGVAKRLQRRIEEWQTDPDEMIRERVLTWKKQQQQIIQNIWHRV